MTSVSGDADGARPDPALLGTWLARDARAGGRRWRWWELAVAAFGLLQLTLGVADTDPLRITVWSVLCLSLALALLSQRRTGTQVTPDGLHLGNGLRWGQLVLWADVEQVRVQTRYGRGSAVVVTGRTRTLHGLAADQVRRLAASLGLPTDDPDAARRPWLSPEAPADAASPVSAPGAGAPPEDDDLEGPFRRG